MAAKNAARPRPGKNAEGTPLKPSYSHTINIEPGKPPTPPPVVAPPPPPGRPAPGQTNPMTHPAHPAMQSTLGTPPPHQSQALPQGGDANPTGNPLGNLVPTPTQDQRQVREQIQFKDMSPPEQAQTAQQQGLDPYAPLRMVQQQTEGAVQGGPSTGPVPNVLAGPYVPPGIEAFPDDFAHLTNLMRQGYAPGASPQEHEFAQNADAMARARITQAMQQSQNGVGAENAQPFAPPQAQPQGAPPGVSLISAIPGAGASTPPAAPPGAMPPPAPGGGSAPPIPPQLLAALMASRRRGALR